MFATKINEIFHSIQGEGRFVGHPAVFVRFHGCSVHCPFCDTAHAQSGSEYKEMGCTEVCQAIKKERGKYNTSLVVITGGEPFEQAERLLPLVRAIRVETNMSVHIETSGTVAPNKDIDAFFDWRLHDLLTLSPKTESVHSIYLQYADVIKCLIGKDAEGDIIPTEIQKILDAGHYDHSLTEGDRWEQTFCFQPIAYKDKLESEQALARAIAMCKKYNVQLSAQLHKYLGIR